MTELEPTDNEWSLPSPKTGESEFEVQAWLWAELRAVGINARGEVKWLDPKVKRRVCRFDLVLYGADDRPFHIVEVKWGPVAHRNGVEATRQGQRYRKFGVPVTFVYGMSDAKKFVEERRWE